MMWMLLIYCYGFGSWVTLKEDRINRIGCVPFICGKIFDGSSSRHWQTGLPSLDLLVGYKIFNNVTVLALLDRRSLRSVSLTSEMNTTLFTFDTGNRINKNKHLTNKQLIKLVNLSWHIQYSHDVVLSGAENYRKKFFLLLTRIAKGNWTSPYNR